MRTIIGADGAAGIITPTGLATDDTTAPFFADTLRTQRLAAFYDFENEAKIFRGVHHQFRFAVTRMTGTERRRSGSRSPSSPDTSRTCPTGGSACRRRSARWSTRTPARCRCSAPARDAEITLGIYGATRSSSVTATPTATPGDCRSERCSTWRTTRAVRGADELADAEFDGWAYQRDGNGSCRCTRPRCSATSTIGTRPTATRHKHN